MLPVNVDGMIWLNTIYSTFHVPFWMGIILSILFAVALMLGIASLASIFAGFQDKTETLMLIGISVVSAIFFACLVKVIVDKRDAFVPEPISYSVYFEENMDYKTLYENYNIISTEGNIVTIELKEN